MPDAFSNTQTDLPQENCASWVHTGDRDTCTGCGYQTKKHETQTPYCPRCGRRMYAANIIAGAEILEPAPTASLESINDSYPGWLREDFRDVCPRCGFQTARYQTGSPYCPQCGRHMY